MDFTLEQLKEIAKKVSLTHSPNIGLDNLKTKLTTYLEEANTTLEEVWKDIESANTFSTDNATVIITEPTTSPEPTIPDENLNPEIERLKKLTFSGVETTQAMLDEAEQTKESLRLIHCIITCHDPAKASLDGELFITRNAEVSVIKKFIPFNVPYHVPQMLLNVIEEKQCQFFIKREVNGIPQPIAKMKSAYSIKILPPITPEQVNSIRNRQLADPINDDNGE